jgi:hypothetical protein
MAEARTPDPLPSAAYWPPVSAGQATVYLAGVTFTGPVAAVKTAAEAYQRALLVPPAVPRPPARLVAKPRQPKVASTVAERVRASVCRKPGPVAQVVGRFPDVNGNTVRGALGTLKAKGLVSHIDGKYGAPCG